MDALTPESAEIVYAGDYLSVSVERWNGRLREIVERPDVAAVVPIDSDGEVTLVRQLRPPARAALLEIPAGRLDHGEDPLKAAQRELAEETGLTGGVWRPLKTYWSTPGFCRERVHLFVAEDLARGEPAPDDGEDVSPVRVPRSEIPRLLQELEDAKTLIGLLLYLMRAG